MDAQTKRKRNVNKKLCMSSTPQKKSAAQPKSKKQRLKLASNENTTEDRTPCLYCDIPYCESTVTGYLYTNCRGWACAESARIRGKKAFICDICK